MLRGIDRRDVFLDDRDYETFLNCITKAKETSDFIMYAYCLMTNHVHMLLKIGSEDVGDIVRRIAVRYVLYHNFQYGRVGHLFQNRFKSEPVDSDSYFITVLRYIHQNPVKAAIVHEIDHYKWSSYNEYIDRSQIIDTEFALDMFEDMKSFKRYMSEITEEKCLDSDTKQRNTDAELRALILAKTDIELLKELDPKIRNEIIRDIKTSTAASNRQLSRILNISRRTINNIN